MGLHCARLARRKFVGCSPHREVIQHGFSRIQSGKTPVQAGGPSMLQMFGLPGLPTDPRYTGGITYQDFPNQDPADLGT